MKIFCNSISISGYEDILILLLKEKLTTYCDKIYQDGIGNLICYKKGIRSEQETQLIAAHIDEVGLQVQAIHDGKIKFKVLGNIKCKNLLHQRIQFENGELGVIYSDSDNIGNYEYEKLYIKMLTNTYPVEIGDVGTFQSNYLETEEYICSKAVDNRVGVWALCQLVMSQEPLKRDTYFVFTVQEEIGLKGMKVAMTSIKPNYFIDIDASAINDRNNVELGKGVAIKVSDSVSVCDRKLVKRCKEICKNELIPYQLEVSDCGTSEIALVSETGYACPSIGLSYPAQEIHTAQSLVMKKDIEALLNLLKNII